ncbi:MAG: SHOCT domain-containing protein [Thaumarchaeota archaeon]|jgi:hypothetical protein|nr:SHOCT domain-containing protein [Candidatus Geocrenenecus arthurdayi]MCL7397178.1 SHOCT domain-containing protein [Candidatus Geocrenenecus arthurdayi]
MKNDEDRIFRILEKLEELRSRGLISEEYYQQRRERLLSLYLEDKGKSFHNRLLPRKRYLKNGIIAAPIIVGLIIFTVIGYSNASAVNIQSVELEKLSYDSISVNVIFKNPTTSPAHISKCLYEFKSEGSTLYNGELRDVRLPAEETKIMMLDIPMKTPRAKKYLSKVASEGLLEGELEISCEVPVLLFGTIQTPILVTIRETEKIRTLELGKSITITNKNSATFRKVITIIPENYLYNLTNNLTPQCILTVEVQTMNSISFKEEGIESVLVDLKGVLEQMGWTDKEFSLITDFLEETTPHLRLVFEGTFTDIFEIILPKSMKIIDIQVLQGNLMSYFVNRARNSIVLDISFVKTTIQPYIVDPYGRAEVMIIFSR